MPDGGKLRIKARDEKRIIKALTRKQTVAKADEQTGIPGAGERLERMEKEIEKFKKTIAGQERRIQLLVAFMKSIDPTFRMEK